MSSFDLEGASLTFYISDALIHTAILEVSKNRMMEKTKVRPVSRPVMFSLIFLSVICFVGLIHVEMELYAHRQMIQVLNQQREEKLEHRNTAHEDKESVMKMSHSDIEKGEESNHDNS